MSLVYLKPEHINALRRILRAHLHHIPLTVFVFGSRTGPTYRPDSDLELLLDSEIDIPLSTLAELKEAFEESDLPFRVDVVLRSTMRPAFYQHICKDLTILCRFHGNEAENGADSLRADST
jgi:predicted nucleotidyltransferase